MQQEIFTTPTWLLNKDIAAITGGIGEGGILSIQQDVLNTVLSPQKINRLMHCQALQPESAFTPDALFTALESGIWSELQHHEPIDIYRRNLQKAYVARLLELQHDATGNTAAMYTTDLSMSDLLSVVKAHEKQLLKKIEQAMISCNNADTKWHLTDLAERLKNTGETNEHLAAKRGSAEAIMAADKEYQLADKMPGYETILQAQRGNCWGNLLPR